MGTTTILRSLNPASRTMNDPSIKTQHEEFEKLNYQMQRACHLHEIRNPIQTINSIVNSLNYDSCTQKNKKIRILKELTDHLVTYLNNKIDVSNQTANTNKSIKIRFDLRELIKSCVLMYQGQASKEVELSYSVDANVPGLLTGDKTALTQILYNLLGNAVKFTDAGYIKISVRLLENIGNKSLIRITISDSGIGICKEKLKIIFKSNVQGEPNTKPQYGGAGLGLAIVKELVLEMDGTIDATSTHGEESVFTLDLPFEISLQSKEFVADHNKKEFNLIGEGKNILIGDDNSFGWEHTQKTLKSWGFAVDLIEREETVISKLNEIKYDIIFLDLFFNKFNGLKIADMIRQDKLNPNKDVPIVIVTGSQAEIQKGKKRHPDITSWILKPFEISEIYTTIKINLSKTCSIKALRVLPEEPLFNNNNMKVKFINKLIPIFCKTTTVELAKMNCEMLNGNLKTVSDIAHKIKPNFYAVELFELSKRAEWIEENIENDCDEIQKIEEFIRDSLQAIQELTGKINYIDSEIKQLA